METSRCRCRPVSDLDFGGPACFFLLDLRRVLDVGCGLAYGLNVDSLNGDVVSFDSDFYAVKYLGGSGCLFPGKVLNFEYFGFFVNLHGDWEVGVYGSEIVPVALGYA